ARHGRGDDDDVVALLTELDEPLAERGRVGGRCRLLLRDLAADLVERCRTVPHDGVLLGEREALPLLRDDVNQARARPLPHLPERVDERVEVVTVDRTDVPEAELLEEHPCSEEALRALLHLEHELLESTGEPPSERWRNCLISSRIRL